MKSQKSGWEDVIGDPTPTIRKYVDALKRKFITLDELNGYVWVHPFSGEEYELQTKLEVLYIMGWDLSAIGGAVGMKRPTNVPFPPKRLGLGIHYKEEDGTEW